MISVIAQFKNLKILSLRMVLLPGLQKELVNVGKLENLSSFSLKITHLLSCDEKVFDFLGELRGLDELEFELKGSGRMSK